MNRRIFSWFVAVLLALGSGISPAVAQREGHDHESGGHEFHDRGGHGHDYHGRDFGHFSRREAEEWRGGHWFHDWHDSRFGWWWVVGGLWYFYPEPVYPYPTYVPPAVIVQQAPPVPSGMPPAQAWYFCDDPKGYYPYVASCAVPWREVPATPPPPRGPPPGQ